MSSVPVLSHFSSQSHVGLLYHTSSFINLHTAKTCCDVGQRARVTLRCLHTSVSIFNFDQTRNSVGLAFLWEMERPKCLTVKYVSLPFHAVPMTSHFGMFPCIDIVVGGCLHLAKQESSEIAIFLKVGMPKTSQYQPTFL